MSNMKSYRAESRKDYGTSDTNLDTEQVKAGAILRLADAAENIVFGLNAVLKENAELKTILDYWKGRAEDNSKRITEQNRQNSALRGVITKLKKKINENRSK